MMSRIKLALAIAKASKLRGEFRLRSGAVTTEQPKDAADWLAHVAPERQWVILLSGRAEVSTSDGERREFAPGAVVLFEDITGKGHLSTPLTPELCFAMIPVTSSGSSTALQ
jgi:hypothetical protein